MGLNKLHEVGIFDSTRLLDRLVFSRIQKNPVCIRRSMVVFLVLYVDDILIIGNDLGMLQSVKAYLCKNFSMKDLGEASYVLGIKLYRIDKGG